MYVDMPEFLLQEVQIEYTQYVLQNVRKSQVYL